VQPTPRWEIVTNNATLRLDHYATLKNAVVTVKDVPVFYLPYPLLPDPEGRSCHRLPAADVRLVAAQGSTISNAFFWAINRSMDATLFHDWMFSRGSGMGAEYRYLLAPQAQGDIKYYFLDEKEAEINGGCVRRARARRSAAA
jgi:LPS-assembly protein